ncbi:Psf2-domain-containing protein [Laetiporus sulphureus 93-53]|uniref:DNA replication complex GINS protein PSF2 n=1 Tax=Laetiporus sulphureus 93-53 TaxID=1314785 RepID=A0A165DUM8_9APHY|nr:Psf2-domain-containing protein [Laetiporus sulphureus 93-53]KZT05661.1 Psf2-domain-containing protein [Laetiporus sulphureus 93-53]
MALPPSLRTSVTPAELEFIASEQLVEIVPLVAMERTAFISGAYGPLRPPAKCKVAIWIAKNLKLKKKCHIMPPAWLNVDFLQDCLARETSQPEFSELPFRFVEIAKMLLDVAPDDVSNPDKIRSLLQDIREARQAKSQEGLSKLDHSELSLPNLCSMEINEIRPFFVRSMGILTQLVREPEAQQEDQFEQ